MTGADCVVMTHYRLTLGYDTAVVGTEMARAAFDALAAGLRTGARKGAFILWHLDENGRRIAPVICKPLRTQP